MALKLVKRKSVPNSEDQSKRQKSREEYLIACLREEQNDPKFSDWEQQFIGSLARQVDQGRKLSERQKEILERIWKK
jgi:predicted ATP-binding protein involved in virulence